MIEVIRHKFQLPPGILAVGAKAKNGIQGWIPVESQWSLSQAYITSGTNANTWGKSDYDVTYVCVYTPAPL
jgi:hypothetical protein